MDERRRRLLKTVMLIRSDFRCLFGIEFTNQCGYFVDQYLSKAIHSYQNWLDYPKGDRVLKEHTSSVFTAVISSDGCSLFTGQSDGWIIMFDLQKGKVIHEWDAHPTWIWSLAHHHSGLLCSGSTDGAISLWNSFDECKHIRNLKGHSDFVVTLDFNKQGSLIVSGATDFSIRLWSVNNGECLRCWAKLYCSVSSALFIDDLIISGSADESIRVWKTDDGECVSVSKQHSMNSINQVCINCDCSLIASLFHFGFTLLSWPEMKRIRTLYQNAHYGQFHPIDPDVLAVGDRSDKSVRLYNVSNQDCIRILKGHTDDVRGICFTPDGSRLVSVSMDNTTRMWDLT